MWTTIAGWIAGFLGFVLRVLSAPVAAQAAVAGAEEQKATDAQAGEATAVAEAGAAVNAPSTVAGVEGELTDDKF